MKSQFKRGDLVYWVGYGKYIDVWPVYEVKWGVIEEMSNWIAYINLYELKNNTRIDGVSIWDWKPDYRKKKLPKGWTYNTRLFELTNDPYPEIMKSLKVNCPEDLLKAIECGILIRVKDNIHWHVEAEVTKDGWMLLRKSDYYHSHIDTVSLFEKQLCLTYEEAFAQKEALIQEFNRQANLSDEEWSKEKIEASLEKLMICLGLDHQNDYIIKIREFIMKLDHIEDVETRVKHTATEAVLEWKYWNKKKWITVEV